MVQKVAYLLGSGATHGAIKSIDSTKSLLTEDIQRWISKELEKDRADPVFDDVIWNEITKDKRDVEHIITVLDTQYKYATANSARELYRNAIVEIAEQVPFEHNLYSVLLDLHLNSKLLEFESLLCLMSLNYDDLLERSIEGHLNRNVDYGLVTKPADPFDNTKESVAVLKLHGSFSWQNIRPIQIAKMNSLAPHETLWVPPGVDKKRENYPFNLLWGKAVEYISECDILRIIGCSLSRNDWGLIPILYTAQRLSNTKGLKIEIVDYTENADSIENNYKYLDVTKMVDLDEIRLYEKTNLSPDMGITSASYFTIAAAKKINCFEKWLDAKIEYLFTDDPFTDNSVMREDLLNKSEAKIAAPYYSKT